MHSALKYLLGTCAVSLGLASCNRQQLADQTLTPTSVKKTFDETAALKEADQLLSTTASLTGTTKEALAEARTTNAAAARFARSKNVFFPGALAIDFAKKQITLPLYKGMGPSGRAVYYILTEAASFNVAKVLGVNYAPKLVNGRDTDGSQEATIVNGQLKFEGDVDFSPVRRVAPGPFPNTFPPAVAQPGAIG